MAINLRSTADIANNGVKMLVFGQSGAGKTVLAATLPNPIILSAEGGLLSISYQDLPYLEISNMAELKEAYTWVTTSAEADKFDSVVLDSISEIAEVVLSHEKANNKDGRAAYGEMNDAMMGIIRDFRDLPGKHVYMSAKLDKQQDEMGRMLYSPAMPGKKMTMELPYFFDEVLAMRIERDGDGNTQRALMCAGDGLWQSKDRSGKLCAWEMPDLGKIIQKIKGEKQ
jgi:hypothetical protein